MMNFAPSRTKNCLLAISLLGLLSLLMQTKFAAAEGSLDVGPSVSPDGLPTRGPAKDVGIVQHLGDSLPLDAEFADEAGNTVKLGDYFSTLR